MSFAPIAPPPRVVVDSTLKIPIRLVRVSNVEDVVVAVGELPDGVTANPLTIGGSESSGELSIKVSGSAKQGPFSAKVSGTTPIAKASVELPLFVRGKPGTLDTTFGVDGRRLNPNGLGAVIDSVLIGPKDEIYVSGRCKNDSPGLCVARLLPDGAADPAYNGGIPSPLTGLASARRSSAALDPTGRVLVGVLDSAGSINAKLGRYAASGQPDESLGEAGIIILDQDANPTTSIAVAPGADGSIYAALTRDGIRIHRLDASGKRIDSFGTSGIGYASWTPLTGYPQHLLTGLRPGPDGAIVFAGSWRKSDGSSGIGVGKLKVDGQPDPAYGSTTGVGTFPAQPGTSAIATAFAADGSLIQMFNATDAAARGAIRISADGKTRDSMFGISGVASFPVEPSGIVLDKMGSILVAIRTPNQDTVVRLTASGQLDSNWANGGTAAVPFSKNNTTEHVTVQSDGRIVVGGRNSEETYVLRIWD